MKDSWISSMMCKVHIWLEITHFDGPKQNFLADSVTRVQCLRTRQKFKTASWMMLDFDVAWDTMGFFLKRADRMEHKIPSSHWTPILYMFDGWLRNQSHRGAILDNSRSRRRYSRISWFVRCPHVKLQLCDRFRNVRQSQIFLLFRSDDPIELFVMIQNLLQHHDHHHIMTSWHAMAVNFSKMLWGYGRRLCCLNMW